MTAHPEPHHWEAGDNERIRQRCPALVSRPALMGIHTHTLICTIHIHNTQIGKAETRASKCCKKCISLTTKEIQWLYNIYTSYNTVRYITKRKIPNTNTSLSPTQKSSIGTEEETKTQLINRKYLSHSTEMAHTTWTYQNVFKRVIPNQ